MFMSSYGKKMYRKRPVQPDRSRSLDEMREDLARMMMCASLYEPGSQDFQSLRMSSRD